MDNCMRYYSDLGKCYVAKFRPHDNAYKREYEIKEIDSSVWEIRSRREAAEFWERAYPFLFYESIPQPRMEAGWAQLGKNVETQEPKVAGKVLKSGERDLILEQRESTKYVEKFVPEEKHKNVEERQEEDFWSDGYWEQAVKGNEKFKSKEK
eukprot:TRINITY_DN45019_c0_g1_i3.p3 TRINITY_DN45019_c0_g1~~TRINITY_DN45019_c0_g1_i3.p3  ORF type:complete len:152 (-),score=26.46 TRINITY_DN45019_c0_g1_i3:152-607(-)